MTSMSVNAIGEWIGGSQSYRVHLVSLLAIDHGKFLPRRNLNS